MSFLAPWAPVPGLARLVSLGDRALHAAGSGRAAFVHLAHVARLADVTLHATVGNLPGGSTLQRLTNGIGGWALVFSLIGLVVGAALWALGAHSQNYHQSFVGRRAVLVSGLAALLIGAAPALINFFFHAGQQVH